MTWLEAVMVVDGRSCRRLSSHLPSLADATTLGEFLAGGGSGGSLVEAVVAGLVARRPGHMRRNGLFFLSSLLIW
jgi:hypothetical protein